MEPNIRKTSTKESLNKFGGLAKKLLDANAITNIYKVSTKLQYSQVTINIVNNNNVDVNFSIWISSNLDTPEEADLLETNVILSKYDTFFRSNVVLGPDEIVYCRANSGHVIVRVEGFEDRY